MSGYKIESKTLKDNTMLRTIIFLDKKLSIKMQVVYKGQLTSDYSDFLLAIKNLQEVTEDEFSNEEDKLNAVSDFSEALREIIGISQYKKIKKFFKDNGAVLTEEDLGKIVAGIGDSEDELPKG